MTRDGLTEENLRDGSVKDISHRSRGRPENKEEFVPERERKKAGNEDSKSGKGKRLQMEKIRKSSVRQEAVENTVEVTPEEKVSGYRKKLHRHEKIPDDDNNLNSQKKSIRKKQLQKQMTKEQAKAGRLSFDDEGNQMVKDAGMKPGGTAGKYIATQAVISGMKAVTSEEEETDENAGVESARLAERETEAALRGLRHAQIRSKRTDVKTHRRGYREATVEKKLKFDSAESMEGVKHAESVKNAEQKRHFYNRFFQKKRYKDAYRAARAGKSAGSLGGATTIAGVENMTVKAKIALKEIIKRNRAMFAGIGIFALLFLVIAVSLGSCSASIEGAGSVIGITTYPSSDEDIYAAENRYAALESALNQQINEMERRHPNYDEYQYNIAEIGHNPYHLISYLTAKYGDWTYSDVENELQSLFEAQYHLNTEGRTETVTETRNVRVGESLGQVVTSGYCNCPICCGVWSGGPTASGAMPQANHTLAVDAANPFLPMGTKVVMNGIEYTVEDTGNFAQYGVQFDVYYDNHAVAEAHGHQTWECFLAEGNQNSVEVTRTVTADVLNVSVQAKPLRSVILSRMEEDEQEIYEEVYSNRGNLQTYKTPVELNWYAYISTYYGYSVNNGTGQTQLHRGVTVNVRQGTEVKSAMNGFVVDVGYSGTFGNYVVTQDKKGVQIKYAYLQSISVANGQEVTTDTVIGTTGSTGSATGSQLYLELVKDGEYYNPVFYISTGDSGLYGGGGSYDDETVRRLFAEADKYLGMPYVWGGSSPETSFDCSGFVSYVFTNSGVCNMGRLTAQGIYDICMPVSPEEARPGDIIFFTGTYDAGEPVTHVGIYAGDGQMIHCGNPIQYTSINSAYWQSHFYAFGRP